MSNDQPTGGDGSYLRAHDAVLSVHYSVYELATTFNNSIAAPRRGTVPPLSSQAFTSMTSNMIALHRVALDLCIAGWAFSVPIICRTQLDILLGLAAIHYRPDRAELLAFRYLMAGAKHGLAKGDPTAAQRKGVQANVRECIATLPEACRDEAHNFIYQDPMPPYWFCPDYKRPHDIIKQHFDKYVRDTYRLLSGAAHGASLGLSFFRDITDDVSPTRRADPSSQSIVLSQSSLLTLNAIHVWALFEDRDIESEYSEIMRQHLACESPVQAMMQPRFDAARQFKEEEVARRRRPSKE